MALYKLLNYILEIIWTKGKIVSPQWPHYQKHILYGIKNPLQLVNAKQRVIVYFAGAHITPEWRKQYIQYEEMKAMLCNAIHEAPSSEVVEPEVLDRYYAKFDETFFTFCEKGKCQYYNYL